MLRFLVALGTLLSTAGATGLLLAPHAPMDEPSFDETTSDPVMVTPMPAVARCGVWERPPLPPDVHREVVGTVDAVQPTLDVAFPIDAPELVAHVVVRFATEWGGPLATHRVRLEDALHRVLRDEQGTTLALAGSGAPVAGTYVARLTSAGVLGVQAVRATVDVHYEAARDASWGEPRGRAPVEWAFLTRLAPLGGDAKVPLDVVGARLLDVKVWLRDATLASVDVQLLDELGNAVREQRAQGPFGSGLVVAWPLDGTLEARTIALRPVGATGPTELVVALTVARPPPRPDPCDGGPYLHATPAPWRAE